MNPQGDTTMRRSLKIVGAIGGLALGIWATDGNPLIYPMMYPNFASVTKRYLYTGSLIQKPTTTQAPAECLPGWKLDITGVACRKGDQMDLSNSARKMVEEDRLKYDQKKIDATFAYMRKHNLSPNEVCLTKLRRNNEDYCQRGGL
jgi:hypothetical protein